MSLEQSWTKHNYYNKMLDVNRNFSMLFGMKLFPLIRKHGISELLSLEAPI